MKLLPYNMSVSRSHLVHVFDRFAVSGCYSLAIELAGELRHDCHNTILVEGRVEDADPNLIWHAQMYGLDVLFVDRIEPEVIDRHEFTGMIMYNVQGKPGLGSIVPSIYYSYGVSDVDTCADVTLVCSNYARFHNRDGTKVNDPVNDARWIMPPMLQTRPLRRLTTPNKALTVGIFTSGSYDKYPCDLVMHLLAMLPSDVNVMISTMPKYRHPGMALAIDERKRIGKLSLCPVRPGAGISYMVYADVVVYGSARDNYEPYGRMVTEAMALGKAVVCETKGAFKTRLEHEIDSLLYDTKEEALGHVKDLISDERKRKQLGANAQLHASWEDATAHIGRLRRILRMIGV